MREDTLLRVSRRAEDTLKIHLCEDTRPGPNEEVYLHTKIHRGPNDRKGVVRILRGALRILTRTMVRSRSHRLTGGRWGSCASAGGAADRGRSGGAPRI